MMIMQGFLKNAGALAQAWAAKQNWGWLIMDQIFQDRR
jgi:hypothetical protein